MPTQDFKKSFQEFQDKLATDEQANEAYADLIATEVNKAVKSPTHTVTWKKDTNADTKLFLGLMEPISDFMRKSELVKEDPFSFESKHSFDESQLDEALTAMEKSADMEDVLTLIIGIFSTSVLMSVGAMGLSGIGFSLDIDKFAVIGPASLILAIFSTGIIFLSARTLATAQSRYLPPELLNISAGVWKIGQITPIENKTSE